MKIIAKRSIYDCSRLSSNKPDILVLGSIISITVNPHTVIIVKPYIQRVVLLNFPPFEEKGDNISRLAKNYDFIFGT